MTTTKLGRIKRNFLAAYKSTIDENLFKKFPRFLLVIVYKIRLQFLSTQLKVYQIE